MKRLLLKTLTVVLLLVVAAVNANAEIISGEIQRLLWEVDTETGVMTISGSGAMPNYRLNRTFISEFEYYDEETGEIAEDAILIKKLIIEEGVTRLGTYAFSGASALEEVVISSSVLTSINNAFAECATLKKVTISEGITSVAASMFEGLTSITEVYFPTTLTSIGTRAFYNCPALKEIHIKDLDAWSKVSVAYYNSLCNVTSEGQDRVTGLYEVKFGEPRDLILNGEKVTKFVQKNSAVGRYLFAGTSIESAELYGKISQGAFYGCSKLKSVDLSNVSQVEVGAFEYCTALTDLTIGSSCAFFTSTGRPLPYNREYGYHFRGCTSLKNITLEEGVEVLPDIFGPLHSPNYQSSTVQRKPLAIENFTIPASLKSIDALFDFEKACFKNEGTYYASSFGNITNEVYIDGELWQVPTGDVVIPDGVSRIGYGKFSEGVTSVKIPASVTNIGANTFRDCNVLADVYLSSATPVAIDASTFSNYQNVTLYVPNGSLAAYKAAESWSNFANIVEWTPTAIEDVQADVTAFEVTADGIQLTAAEGKAVAVYAASGALVVKIDSYAGEEISLDKGVYVVRVAGKSVKVKL